MIPCCGRTSTNGRLLAARTNFAVKLGPTDEQRVLGTKLRQLRFQGRGLALAGLQLVDDNHLALGGLGGQRGTQAKLADLLRKRVAVVTDNRTMDNTAATELDNRSGAVTGTAGALLAVHLGRRAGDLAAALHLVGAGAALGQLPVDDTGDDVGTRSIANTSSASVMSPAALLSSVVTLTFIVLTPSSAASSAGASSAGASSAKPPLAGASRQRHRPAPRQRGGVGDGVDIRPAGNGRPSGSFAFTASLISTQPPFGPGTAP